uniref:Uncharacterized protein n=1 Tax=Rhizophora mucronata TaxID=61149 RepID=A0A2P2IXH4_RHIMU
MVPKVSTRPLHNRWSPKYFNNKPSLCIKNIIFQ